MAILVTRLRHAGVPVDKRLAELVRYDDEQQPQRIRVEIHERPPITVPASRARSAASCVPDGPRNQWPSATRAAGFEPRPPRPHRGAGERLGQLPHRGEGEELRSGVDGHLLAASWVT